MRIQDLADPQARVTQTRTPVLQTPASVTGHSGDSGMRMASKLDWGLARGRVATECRLYGSSSTAARTTAMESSHRRYMCRLVSLLQAHAARQACRHAGATWAATATSSECNRARGTGARFRCGCRSCLRGARWFGRVARHGAVRKTVTRRHLFRRDLARDEHVSQKMHTQEITSTIPTS